LSILDIGCGMKPYKIFFKEKTEDLTYVGIDINLNSAADAISVGEYIPFKTNSFKSVICTQALEHTNNPNQVVEEILHILENNGSLLISTHGVWIEGHEHPDNWRWTRTGLIKLLQLNGYEVESCHSMPPITSVAQIMLLYIPEIAPLKYSIIPFLNITAILLAKAFKGRGPKIHIVHVLRALKSTSR
jgi:SAM-dependent methyltransferase